MEKVCVFLADGFEEIEALTVVDMLRRANEEVVMVSIMGSMVHNIMVLITAGAGLLSVLQ